MLEIVNQPYSPLETLMQMKEVNEYENTYQSYLTACASDGPHPPHSLLPSLAS